MMRSAWRTTLACAFAVGGSLAVGPPPARAQGPIGSLGGYGAMAGAPGPSMGAGAMAPFAGRFGATTPSRMGGGGPLGFSARTSAVVSGDRPSFTIGPTGGGMTATPGGMSPGFGRRPFALPPLGPWGGGMRPMAGSRGMGVMPPSFGYPFRQPPRLVSPSSAGAGMSM